MLRGTYSNPNTVLGKCPPSLFDCTVEHVAINAVMAGCEPCQLELLIAAVRAMLSKEFNLHGVHATTMGATPMIIVNGEIIERAKLNFKHGALGSGSRSNACVGRCIKLILQNVGKAKLGG